MRTLHFHKHVALFVCQLLSNAARRLRHNLIIAVGDRLIVVRVLLEQFNALNIVIIFLANAFTFFMETIHSNVFLCEHSTKSAPFHHVLRVEIDLNVLERVRGVLMTAAQRIDHRHERLEQMSVARVLLTVETSVVMHGGLCSGCISDLLKR